MLFELLRTAVLYVHLIACCVGIALVLSNDVRLITQLIRSDRSLSIEVNALEEMQNTALAALLVLWVTGLLLLALDVSLKDWTILDNPKLQSKLIIVICLTVNGYILHSLALPLMRKAGNLLQLSVHRRLLVVFAGTVSGVSWFYAALLGVARMLNWKYTILEIIAAYPILIAAGTIAVMTLTERLKRKTSDRPNQN